MTNKRQNGHKSTAGADAIETHYLEFLHTFYEEEDRERALTVAERLEAALAERPDFADSIRAQEIRSLLAELRGDLAEAIHRRECEIRKILELHSIARDQPGWDLVLRQYDYADVSDRLDLLAILHADNGDLESAIATLKESKLFCESHRIPFDGSDLLKDFQKGRRGKATTRVRRQVRSK